MNREFNDIEILLVEDDMDDASVKIKTLNKIRLGDHLMHVMNRAEGLSFLFSKENCKL